MKELTNRAELVRARILSPEQDKISEHQKTTVSEHIGAYIDYQQSRGRNRDHVNTYESRLLRSAQECGFRWLSDLNADRLERWLSSLTELPKDADENSEPRLVSASVYNGFVEAWVAFGNWMIGKRVNGRRSNMNGEKRMLTNPFDGMGKRDKNQDRRRIARALTEDELHRLFAAAKTRPVIAAETVRRGPNKGKRMIKLSDSRRRELEKLGEERALIYKTAVLTGLRKSELRSLVVSDLSFGDVPFVKLQHKNEKNRQGSTLALRADLAAELQRWTKGKERSDKVFRVPSSFLEILDRDMEAAGIPKVDEDGRVAHLHALRHSFGTHLSKAGVSPRVTQAAMRHSNINLTMGTYTDARLLDTAAAVEALPSFDGDAGVQSNRKQRPNCDAPHDAPTTGLRRHLESSPDHSVGNADDGKFRPR
ncbi:site-specific recombinase, phage integrase family protein, partial [Rhodopirellula europaea 6C]